MADEDTAPIRERTSEEKLDYLILRVGELTARLNRLEGEVLPQEPDPDVGLP